MPADSPDTRPMLAPCPACGGAGGPPRLHARPRFGGFTFRFGCECGVSGAWMPREGDESAEAVAARGWRPVAGDFCSQTPPVGRRFNDDVVLGDQGEELVALRIRSAGGL